MYKGNIPNNAETIDSIRGTLEGIPIQAWLHEAYISLGCQSDFKQILAIFIEVWRGDKKYLYRYTGREAQEKTKWNEFKKAIIV